MKRIKSAFEIAMEKANQIDDHLTPEEERLVKREQLKPLLARFYKGEIDAEGLWQNLKEEQDCEVLEEAQLLLIDSLGLRTPEEQFKRRKEAILAIETLKEEQNSSFLEQILNQVHSLQEKYTRERKRINDLLEKEIKNNSQMRMRPVRTQDGKTVMKLESAIDEKTERRFKNSLTELEARSGEMFNRLLKELKGIIQNN
ncbi:MAG: hypothetical protein PWR10_1112 [Halanaerobiales bacterium]|nr:hypothetical protein [Halanaerobiales bacterium]